MLDIDIAKLTKLIESFYKLTKIKITVYDDEFNEIFSCPNHHSAFCTMMNEKENIHCKCKESAKVLCELCKKERRLVTQTCHAGLTETVAPLCERDLIIGYIMFGQITNVKDKEKFASRARQMCEGYSLNKEEFESKIRMVPYKTNDQIEAVSEIINAITYYIYLQGIVTLKREERLATITDYIHNNLASDLSVQAICERFFLSKTVLYELTKNSMPGGIAKYIRVARLEKAKELLLKTDNTIEEISGMVGFLDCNYFRRIFKSTYQISASTYRKNKKTPF